MNIFKTRMIDTDHRYTLVGSGERRSRYGGAAEMICFHNAHLRKDINEMCEGSGPTLYSYSTPRL